MAAKRESAFNRALREAQQPVRSEPAPPETPPSVEAPQLQHDVVAERNKGGRPRGEPKTKVTLYLLEETEGAITAIKKAMVRHADMLIEDKGSVVDQAIGVMLFALEDAASRDAFLEIYERWQREGRSRG